jgi:hypothetical protein
VHAHTVPCYGSAMQRSVQSYGSVRPGDSAFGALSRGALSRAAIRFAPPPVAGADEGVGKQRGWGILKTRPQSATTA